MTSLHDSVDESGGDRTCNIHASGPDIHYQSYIFNKVPIVCRRTAKIPQTGLDLRCSHMF